MALIAGAIVILAGSVATLSDDGLAGALFLLGLFLMLIHGIRCLVTWISEIPDQKTSRRL